MPTETPIRIVLIPELPALLSLYKIFCLKKKMFKTHWCIREKLNITDILQIVPNTGLLLYSLHIIMWINALCSSFTWQYILDQKTKWALRGVAVCLPCHKKKWAYSDVAVCFNMKSLRCCCMFFFVKGQNEHLMILLYVILVKGLNERMGIFFVCFPCQGTTWTSDVVVYLLYEQTK